MDEQLSALARDYNADPYNKHIEQKYINSIFRYIFSTSEIEEDFEVISEKLVSGGFDDTLLEDFGNFALNNKEFNYFFPNLLWHIMNNNNGTVKLASINILAGIKHPIILPMLNLVTSFSLAQPLQ